MAPDKNRLGGFETDDRVLGISVNCIHTFGLFGLLGLNAYIWFIGSSRLYILYSLYTILFKLDAILYSLYAKFHFPIRRRFIFH